MNLNLEFKVFKTKDFLLIYELVAIMYIFWKRNQWGSSLHSLVEGGSLGWKKRKQSLEVDVFGDYFSRDGPLGKFPHLL